jgi:serine/threonine protein kinase
LAARLHEPHIIPIHDFGQIDGRLFIDMRLVEGGNLAARLSSEGPLPARRAVEVVAQVAAALDSAHAEGMIHRDIKPSNVLLAPGQDGADGDFVYPADFGVARDVSQASASLTLTGGTVESLEYMAPERFTGGHGDRRSDVYALGCLLFEALTARKPFVVEGLPGHDPCAFECFGPAPLAVIAADRQYVVFLAVLPLVLSLLMRAVPRSAGLSVGSAMARGDPQTGQLLREISGWVRARSTSSPRPMTNRRPGSSVRSTPSTARYSDDAEPCGRPSAC